MHLIPSIGELLLQLDDRRAGLRGGGPPRGVQVLRTMALVQENAAVEILAAPA